jgi:hypothetical protein
MTWVVTVSFADSGFRMGVPLFLAWAVRPER